MLVARGKRSLREARMGWALAFGKGFWFKIVELDGLVYDTRFAPAAPGPAKPNVCFIALLRGKWQAHGTATPCFEAPSVIPLSLAQLEGADHRRPFTFCSWDNPRVIEIHCSELDVLRWPPSEPPSLDHESHEAAIRATRIASNDDDDVRSGLIGVLQGLARRGILRPEAVAGATATPGAAILRFWSAVQPAVERLMLSATVDELASAGGLTSGQVERAFQRFLSTFGVVGVGVRSLAFHVRMKTAAIFLSAPEVSVAEVAELVGYRSADAMTRAFRDSGLPPPSEIQRELRLAR